MASLVAAAVLGPGGKGVAQGGRAKVLGLLRLARLPTSTSTLCSVVTPTTTTVGTAKLLQQQKRYGAAVAKLSPPAPHQRQQPQQQQQQQQPRAVATTTTTTNFSGMGDSNPRGAANSVTSWDLTKPLPKLPVPDLASTLDKYLTLLTPVLSPQELEMTKQHVQEFTCRGGWGEKLQNHLLKRQADMDNWVYDWWLDDMYLKIRLALPINSNPGMVFPRETFSGLQQQLSYASRFISGLLDYKLMIDSGNIPVERCRFPEKGQPMCMEQHYRMFSSYRRPGIPKDEQLTTLGKDGPPYCVVACRDQFYKLDLESAEKSLNVREIYTQLSKVVAAAESESAGAPTVGVLTATNRSRWAEARERLLQGLGNASNIDIIENCLFLLCLDKPTLPTCNTPEDDTEDLTGISLHMLHGQGTAVNTCNRWFDKTLQFVVAENGSCGLNYEHSVGEGLAPIQIVDHALTYMSKDDVVTSLHQRDARELPEPVRLVWTVSSQTQEDIQRAKEEIDTLIDNLDLCLLKFEGYGRDFPKNQGFSPDAFIQLALQLTYYKVHGKLVTTYESASLRRFRQGRVDNIRANSPTALAWIRAMLGEVEATTEERFALFQEAAAWQQKYQTDTVVRGQGIDCHLLGLREAAAELDVLGSVPFFSDPSFAKAHYFALSTSQVATGADSFMYYGPVVPDGYGACYNPTPGFIYVCVTSFRDCPDTDSQMFVHSLESSFLQMRELCLLGKESANL